MGRPLRHQSADTYYFITNRCVAGMFLLRPDPEVNRIISGCLAREADKHDVDLVCFGFFSNHFHMIARFPRLNRGSFVGRVTGEISDRLNSYWDRSGTMFPERYDCQALCDDQIVRDKICYTLNNPVKDGLVRSAEAWPGVTSMSCHQSGDDFEGRWLDYKKWTKLRRRKESDHDRSEAMRCYAVELTLPDALEGETDEERRESLLDMVDADRERLYADVEEETGHAPTFMGKEKILGRHWLDRPRDSDIDRRGRSKRRLYVSSEPGGAAARREKHRERTKEYRHAAKAMRKGENAAFPQGMHPPGHARCVGHRQACEDYQAASDA